MFIDISAKIKSIDKNLLPLPPPTTSSHQNRNFNDFFSIELCNTMYIHTYGICMFVHRYVYTQQFSFNQPHDDTLLLGNKKKSCWKHSKILIFVDIFSILNFNFHIFIFFYQFPSAREWICNTQAQAQKHIYIQMYIYIYIDDTCIHSVYVL